MSGLLGSKLWDRNVYAGFLGNELRHLGESEGSRINQKKVNCNAATTPRGGLRGPKLRSEGHYPHMDQKLDVNCF